MITVVTFIRHCESSGQAPDAPLTSKGQADAFRLPERLSNLRLDALYTSPWRRALQTIEPLAAARSLPIFQEPRLRERLLSTQDLDDWLEHVRRSFVDIDYRASGGESLREAQIRGLAALRRIADEGHAHAAIASHGNLLSSLLHAVDPAFGFESWRGMPNPALYRVTLDAGMPVAFESMTWQADENSLCCQTPEQNTPPNATSWSTADAHPESR